MSGNPGCSVPSSIHPSLQPPPFHTPPPPALVWQSTAAGPHGPPGRPAVLCVGVAGRRGVGAAPTPRHWMEAHPVRGKTSRKVPVWPPVQVTPRQPRLSCGARLAVASFLPFFAYKKSVHLYFGCSFAPAPPGGFSDVSASVVSCTVRPLAQQCQSLLVVTVSSHPESDFLLSRFVRISLYLALYADPALISETCLLKETWSQS